MLIMQFNLYMGSHKFVSNYYKGTQAFVDEYWKMIHKAAGWKALRVWLLVSPHSHCEPVLDNHVKVLVVRRFLTGSEVAQILKYYEGLTGRDHARN